MGYRVRGEVEADAGRKPQESWLRRLLFSSSEGRGLAYFLLWLGFGGLVGHLLADAFCMGTNAALGVLGLLVLVMWRKQ